LFEISTEKANAEKEFMKYRPLGRTGWNVSEVSFGAWAIGGTWGEVDDATSLAALTKRSIAA
jgi:aryl-alcohol dehydrogenase-like predicted oxidoreductase